MFSSIRNFLHRHRRKFVITGAIVGGAYLLTNYAQRKLREWQEKEAKKFFDMTRKKQHFESTERTCNQTILTLSKILSDNILSNLNTEEIVQMLQENPENKLTLWEQMKIMIFSRVCVLVYSLTMLQVMLRVQLNVIGGYLYRDSTQDSDHMVDSKLQAEYLALCHNFISDGIKDLTYELNRVVKKVVEPISLKKKLSLHEIEQIFWSIQTTVSTDLTFKDPVNQMVNFLIDHKEISDGKLDTLVKETMDILESDEVVSLTKTSISRCFSTVVDEIANLFVSKAPVASTSLDTGDHHVVTNGAMRLNVADSFVDVNKVELHFVKLLPAIDELITRNKCKNNVNIPELLTQQLTLTDKLKVLGANIYEVFSSP